MVIGQYQGHTTTSNHNLDSRALIRALYWLNTLFAVKFRKCFNTMIYNKTTDIASKFSAITKNIRSVNKYSKNIFECLDQCKH